MDDQIQLISDDDGVAVIGHPAAVDRFLVSEGLPSKDLGLPRLASILAGGSATAQAGAQIAATSGRWVKLTEGSARLMQGSTLMKGPAPGVHRAVVTDNGKIKGVLQIATTPGSMLTNPAVLAGAAGVMAQLALQQSMQDITDYLAAIDTKVDDVLRAQKDAVLADMTGVEFLIDEAMTLREQVGRVSEVTWSKVQTTSMTIGRTQAYALRQLDAIAEELERESDVDDVAKLARRAVATVQEWLAVLARCVRLHDAIAVLEVDRVLDAGPEELDRHRLAIRATRQNRLDLIARCTERLLARMDTAATAANTKVLLNPFTAPAVVQSSNQVAITVVGFQRCLGIGRERESVDARPWRDAATEVRDKVLVAGAGGVDSARQRGGKGLERAKAGAGTLARGIASRTTRRRRDGQSLP